MSKPIFLFLILLPLIQLSIVWFSTKNKKLVTQNIAVTHLDLLFIPFNILIILGGMFHTTTFMIYLAIAIIPTIIIHIFYKKVATKKETLFFVNNHITSAGIAHMLFMIIQISMIGLLFTANINTWIIWLCYGVIMIYLAAFLRYNQKTSPKTKTEQILIIISGIATVCFLLKTIF